MLSHSKPGETSQTSMLPELRGYNRTEEVEHGGLATRRGKAKWLPDLPCPYSTLTVQLVSLTCGAYSEMTLNSRPASYRCGEGDG